MTHTQILNNYRSDVASLFATYGITAPVNATSLKNAMIQHPNFSDDLSLQIGIEDKYENALGKRIKTGIANRKVKRANKKADKANGIAPKKKGIRGLLGGGKKKNTTKYSNDTKGFLAGAIDASKDGASAGVTSDGNLTSEVQEVQDTGSKKSVVDKIQGVLDGAGAIAGGIGGVIDTFKNGGSAGAGGDFGGVGSSDDAGGAGGENTKPSMMDWLKKNWYIPVAVVAVAVVAVIALRPKKAGK